MVLVHLVKIELEVDPLIEDWLCRGCVVGLKGELAVAHFEWGLGDAGQWDGELVGREVCAGGFVCWLGGHDDGLEVLVFGASGPVGDFVVAGDGGWEGWRDGGDFLDDAEDCGWGRVLVVDHEFGGMNAGVGVVCGGLVGVPRWGGGRKIEPWGGRGVGGRAFEGSVLEEVFGLIWE